MALEIDGYAVFGAVAAMPELFPDIRPEVARTARALVVRQLKAKALPLVRLRQIRRALGAENFALIADGMSDAEIRALVARLDRHHPELKAASPEWCRAHLEGLAAGEEPAPRSGAGPEPAGPSPERALAKRPFAAAWDGRDHDAPPAAKGKKKG